MRTQTPFALVPEVRQFYDGCLLLSGAILTETIFSWPGVGNWLIHGVQSRDYPVVQGGILLIAADQPEGVYSATFNVNANYQ